MIDVKNLHKRFGKVTAVEDVTFRAEDGVVTGLLGPNGGGSARVDGLDVAERPLEVRQAIGVLPDARGLYPRLTAREHVRYAGELHGLSGAALDQRIDELVELLDMKDIAQRRTEGFSQGERMKVALARALVHGPRNVLLDEPTNGLDVMSTRAVRTLIQRLRERGHCIVFSSHVMQEVAALCDRIVVVARGRVVADGTADELRARTGKDSLEEAFVTVIGSEQGLMQ
jgi:sodium transport system ATP-binding protein